MEKRKYERSLLAFPKETEELVLRDRFVNEDVPLNLLDVGLRQVKSIVFRVPGKIRRLGGQFDHILRLDCQHQHLRQFLSVLPLCQELNLSHNLLDEIHLKSIAPRVERFSASDNNMRKLDLLPSTLQQLVITNNALGTLDLGTCPRLERLEAEGNPFLQVVQVPLSLLHMNIDSLRTTDVHFGETKEPAAASDYEETLHLYFRLKHEYEKTKQKWCVQCRRQVGCVFESTAEKYLAHCGATTNPCSFRIELFRGDVVYLPLAMEVYEKEKVALREQVIQLQLDSLFGYKKDDEVIKQSEELNVAYTATCSIAQTLLDEYVHIHFDPFKEIFRKLKETERKEILFHMANWRKEYAQHRKKETLTAMMKEYEKLYPNASKQTPFGRVWCEVVYKSHSDIDFLFEQDDPDQQDQQKQDQQKQKENQQKQDQQKQKVTQLVCSTAKFNKNDVVFGESPRVVECHYDPS